MTPSGTVSRAAAVAVLAAAAACAPGAPSGPRPDAAGLPAIPRADGPLAIRVVHPTPATPRPSADSTLVYGSVGTGRATLTIDGQPVEVEPNGAFLAWVAVPASGAYRLEARAGGRTVRETVSYRAPAPPAPARADTAEHAAPAPAPAASAAPADEAFAAPVAATVTAAADTLASGSGVAIGRPAPGGAYRYFLPRGARLAAVGRRGDQVQVRLDAGTTAWFAAEDLTLGEPVPAGPAAPLGPVSVRPAERWVDVRIPARGAPFRVEPGEDAWRVALYGVPVTAAEAGPAGGDPLLTGVRGVPGAEGGALELALAGQPWGYKAFYEADGTLVLRLRRPPAIDPARPLAGLRVMVDPGHPPGGATGPTGLAEAEANLAIALPLAEMLRERGAQVRLTRATPQAVALGARPEEAVRWDADLLVSVHNNGFPEGVNPFRNDGTSTYFFHPFSAGLARALNEEVVEVTRIRDLGPKQGNLALVRPTWFPSALTESLFMPLPRQEAALRDAAFVRRLAGAHVRGLERFLRGRAAEAQGG